MTWQIALVAAAAFLSGWLARGALTVLGERLDDRAEAARLSRATRQALTVAVAPTEHTEAEAPSPELIITPRCPEGWSAKQILGYFDLGSRRIAPTYPGTLDGWDARHRRVDDHAAAA